MSKIMYFISFTMLSFLMFSNAQAAEFKVIYSPAPVIVSHVPSIKIDKNQTVIRTFVLTGLIAPGDGAKFDKLIESTDNKNIMSTDLVLNSPGGNLNESVKILSAVLKGNFTTIVEPKKQCLNTCFTIFIAGRTRVAFTDNILGSHRIGNYHDDMGVTKVYNKLHVPESIILKILETPEDDIYILDRDELCAITRFGFDGPSECLTPDSEFRKNTLKILNGEHK